MAKIFVFQRQKQARGRENDKSLKRQSARAGSRRVVISVGKPQTKPTDLAGQAREIIQDARDEAFKIRKAAEEEAHSTRREILEIEKRVAQKEESLAEKLSAVEKVEEHAKSLTDALARKEQELAKVRQDLVTKLQKVTGLTVEEAKRTMLASLKDNLRTEIAKQTREAEEEVKATAKARAQEILVNSMIAGATDWVAEYTITTVKLESDEIKGRIIGKEGRNIRAFELATGVDVELDSDVAGEVRLSSFDPIRREVARIALEKLVKDTRIQPTRIEGEVQNAKALVEKDMSEAGRRAAYEVGLYNLPQAALDTLGRLKFRYSYGQNQLAAAIETGKIAKKLAYELGADPVIAGIGGTFHDIGKTEMEKEGTHVQLGVELGKIWGFPQKVIDAIAQHHEDEPFTSVESIIVHLADAVSGARPGARHEPVEAYIKRLTDIEKIATSFAGVDRAYAIQAGREIRVIVKPDIVDDEGIVLLSHDIRERLERELTYPGQIVVTVIRETRAVDIAK